MARSDELIAAGQESQTKSTVGPIKWMAPEQLEEQKYSTASDVWSFGVIVVECLTRQPPWGAMSNMKVAQQVLNGKHLQAPAGTLPVLVEVIEDAFEMNAKDRPRMSNLVKRLGRHWDANGVLKSRTRSRRGSVSGAHKSPGGSRRGSATGLFKSPGSSRRGSSDDRGLETVLSHSGSASGGSTSKSRSYRTALSSSGRGTGKRRKASKGKPTYDRVSGHPSAAMPAYDTVMNRAPMLPPINKGLSHNAQIDVDLEKNYVSASIFSTRKILIAFILI